ncbi:MAG: hypothetical protein QME81_09930 [bacterium]|nr:hypothetical protein [bacterium]
MTEEKLFQKNVILGGEFTKYVLDHPEILDEIPRGAHVFILPQDDPELLEANIRMADKALIDGETVVYVKVDKLRPETHSRLVNPRLEVAAAA